MVASLLFTFLGAHIQTPKLKLTTPVVIAGVVGAGRCRIPIDVAGKTYLFLVDTGIEKSYIRSDVKANALTRDPLAKLILGDISIAVAEIGRASCRERV